MFKGNAKSVRLSVSSSYRGLSYREFTVAIKNKCNIYDEIKFR